MDKNISLILERNAEYWHERYKPIKENTHKQTVYLQKQIEDQYRQAMYSLNKDIIYWYKRLAKNNGNIGMADAKKLLDSEQLAEFKWDVEEYIKKGREYGLTGKWARELENASARVHIRQYQALKLQMQNHLEVMTAKNANILKKGFEGVYKDTFYKSTYELQKGFEIGTRLDLIDENHIEHVLNHRWGSDGINGTAMNYSDRIWKNKDKLLKTLDEEVKQGLIRGDQLDDIIDRVSAKMGVARGHASTLVRTEAAVIDTRATADSYRDIGVEYYTNDVMFDERTTDICEHIDEEKPHKLADMVIGKNAPPFHYNCRTTIIPHIDDEFEREFDAKYGKAATKGNGEVYYVKDKDISYEKWYNDYVVKNKPKPTGIGNWVQFGNASVFEIFSGKHYKTNLTHTPNSIVEHTTVNGGVGRDFYDENGFIAKQIHNHPHSSKKNHPFGKNGEHGHYWKYDGDGNYIEGSRDPQELKQEDIDFNIDILEWLNDD